MRKSWESAAKKEKISADEAQNFLACVSVETSLDNANMRSTDLVVEAVFENMEVKRGVFATLDTVSDAYPAQGQCVRAQAQALVEGWCDVASSITEKRVTARTRQRHTHSGARTHTHAHARTHACTHIVCKISPCVFCRNALLPCFPAPLDTIALLPPLSLLTSHTAACVASPLCADL